jgi:hypothetical protein
MTLSSTMMTTSNPLWWAPFKAVLGQDCRSPLINCVVDALLQNKELAVGCDGAFIRQSHPLVEFAQKFIGLHVDRILPERAPDDHTTPISGRFQSRPALRIRANFGIGSVVTEREQVERWPPAARPTAP